MRRPKPEEHLLTLAHGLDFARRYYMLAAPIASARYEGIDLPEPEIESILQSTGRVFRFNRKERFYSTREVNTPGELGLNLVIRGSVEFILVVRGPGGHFGRTFHGLALTLAERHAPELVPSPRYPRPDFSSAEELRLVLTSGLGLYDELAAAIRASELLGE